MNLVGKKFQVASKVNGKPSLCTGVVEELLGEKEGLFHYKATIEICFNPAKRKTVQGEIAVSNSKFYVATRRATMLDVSGQIEWAN